MLGRPWGWGSHQECFGGYCLEGLGAGDSMGHIRKGLDLGPHACLAHPKEVIIHQQQPFKATCVVEDHSGRSQAALQPVLKSREEGRRWAEHRLRQTQRGH